MKEFMQKKDVDKIRVSDICEAAEIELAMFSAMPADMHRVLFGETRA